MLNAHSAKWGYLWEFRWTFSLDGASFAKFTVTLFTDACFGKDAKRNHAHPTFLVGAGSFSSKGFKFNFLSFLLLFRTLIWSARRAHFRALMIRPRKHVFLQIQHARVARVSKSPFIFLSHFTCRHRLTALVLVRFNHCFGL